MFVFLSLNWLFELTWLFKSKTRKLATEENIWVHIELIWYKYYNLKIVEKLKW